jgi:hypothetical protein
LESLCSQFLCVPKFLLNGPFVTDNTELSGGKVSVSKLQEYVYIIYLHLYIYIYEFSGSLRILSKLIQL